MNRYVWICVLVGAVFGLTFLGMKTLLVVMPPMSILALRWLMASVVFLILVSLKILKVNFKGKPIRKVILIGLLQPCIYATVELMGIQRTTISEASILLALGPIFTAIIMMLFFKVKVTTRSLIGISLAFIGMAFAVGLSDDFDLASKWQGYLFLLLACTSSALYGIYVNRYANHFTATESTFIMSIMGAGFFNIIVLFKGDIVTTYTVVFSSLKIFIAAFFLGVICSVFAYFLFNFALTRIEPHIGFSIMINTVAIVGIISGIIFEGNDYGLNTILGVSLVALGVIFSKRKKGTKYDLNI